MDRLFEQSKTLIVNSLNSFSNL